MELKKNFILNPLAPEFVPGRLYHGLPSSASANENFFPNVPQPQPLLFFPMPGPPLIQHTMTMTPPMHPYLNNVPCVVPPMMPPAHAFHPMGMPPTSNIPQRPTNTVPRIPPTYPRKGMPHPQVKEFENGMGRPLKRNDKEVPEPEDMKRLVYNQVHEQGESFSHPVETENFQNFQGVGYGYEDKVRKLALQVKSEELPNGIIKNGMINEQKVHHFPDRHQHMRSQPQMNEIWNSPMPQSKYQEFDTKLHPEMDAVNSFATNEENVRNSLEFKRMPSSDNRFVFDNHSQSMFMPVFENKNNMNEQPANMNQSENSMYNVPVVQTSLLEKLALLQKILPAGTDIQVFLENDDQLRDFMQILCASEGQEAAKAFLLLIAAIKKDQQLLQLVHTNFHSQKKMVNTRQFSPLRNVPDSSAIRNMHNFNSRPVMSNSHVQDGHIMNEHINTQQAQARSFPQARGFPMDKFDPGPFINTNHNRMDMPKMQQNQAPWFMENGVVNNRQHVHDPPSYDMAKLSIGNPLENKIERGIDMFPMYFPNAHPNRGRNEFDRPEENLRHMWASQEFKPYEAAGTPFQFSEPGRQGSYLSKLRNISNVVNGGSSHEDINFDLSLSEKAIIRSNPPEDLAPGPLSMSYPDIPNILSRISMVGGEPSPKVIRKPIGRSSEPNAMSPSPFLFDVNVLQSGNDSPLRYQPLSSEGMTYAKILRSPQQ